MKAVIGTGRRGLDAAWPRDGGLLILHNVHLPPPGFPIVSSAVDICLPRTAAAWGGPDFEAVLKAELAAVGAVALPLQGGLRRGSVVVEAPVEVMPISAREHDGRLHLRVGVFYAGILAGCGCADDPTPVEAEPEYCVLMVELERAGGCGRVWRVEDEA